MADKNPIRIAIIDCLKQKDGYVSGGELCVRFRVTRAAVWKQIQELRRRGYRIEGVPSTGYRLLSVPDILSESEILCGCPKGKRIGAKIHVLETTVSTNEYAWLLAEGGAREGEVVIAEEQTGGKGRRGRVWASPGGVNLYTSLILRPRILPHQAPLITLLASVAIAQVVREGYAIEAAIKWPNDVLVEGKKVAGILSEMSAEADGVHFLILGIGVNLNMTSDMFPSEMLYPGTSLCVVTGRKVNRASFAGALYTMLDYWYDVFLQEGSTPVRDAWLKACVHHGQILGVETAAGIRKGWFAGLGEDGCLLLKTSQEGVERIHAGDVLHSVPASS